jgi:hypothetical protein
MLKVEIIITNATDSHARLQLYLNGGLVSGPQGITVRVSELLPFLYRLDSERVQVYRENITDRVFHRLVGYRSVIFL